jgi:hypothetical protein
MGIFRKKKRREKGKVRGLTFFDSGKDFDPWELPTIRFFGQKNTLEQEHFFPTQQKSEKNEHSERMLYATEKILMRDEERNDPFPNVQEVSLQRVGKTYEKVREIWPFPEEPRSQESSPSEEFENGSEAFEVDLQQKLLAMNSAKASQTLHCPSVDPQGACQEEPKPAYTAPRLPENAPIPEKGAEVASLPEKAAARPLHVQSENAFPARQSRKLLQKILFIHSLRRLLSESIFLKVLISLALLFFGTFVLWGLNKKNTLLQHQDIPIIYPPKNFKQRPEAVKNPFIPYQEELIFGKLDDGTEEKEGEKLLPYTDFAPELPDEDILPESSSKKKRRVPSSSAKTNDSPREDEDLRVPKEFAALSKPKEETQNPTTSLNTPKENDAKKTSNKVKTTINNTIYIQLGTLNSVEKAQQEKLRLAKKIKEFPKQRFFIWPYRTPSKTVYRLLLGAFASEDKATAAARTIGIPFKIVKALQNAPPATATEKKDKRKNF